LLTAKIKISPEYSYLETYEGSIHEFFGMAAVLPEAKGAQSLAAAESLNKFS